VKLRYKVSSEKVWTIWWYFGRK